MQASRVMPPNCTLPVKTPSISLFSTSFPGIARHIEDLISGVAKADAGARATVKIHSNVLKDD